MGSADASPVRHRNRRVLVFAIAVIAVVLVVLGALGHRGRDTRSSATGVSSAKRLVESGGAVRSTSRLPRTQMAMVGGRVVDDGQAPLAHVKVCVLAPSPQCAMSDASGAFVIADLAVDDAEVLGVAAQLAHYVVVDSHHTDASAANHADVLLTMKPGGVELTGVVRDVGGGPIAHAIITVGESIAESDREGSYTLWTAPDSAAVTAIADGYATSIRVDQPPSRLDFALVPEASVSGRVVDAVTGRAMPQMHLIVHDAAGNAVDAYVTTDDDGRFRADKLAPAIYELRVDDAHAVAIHASSLPIALGEHVEGVAGARRARVR